MLDGWRTADGGCDATDGDGEQPPRRRASRLLHVARGGGGLPEAGGSSHCPPTHGPLRRLCPLSPSSPSGRPAQHSPRVPGPSVHCPIDPGAPGAYARGCYSSSDGAPPTRTRRAQCWGAGGLGGWGEGRRRQHHKTRTSNTSQVNGKGTQNEHSPADGTRVQVKTNRNVAKPPSFMEMQRAPDVGHLVIWNPQTRWCAVLVAVRYDPCPVPCLLCDLLVGQGGLWVQAECPPHRLRLHPAAPPLPLPAPTGLHIRSLPDRKVLRV